MEDLKVLRPLAFIAAIFLTAAGVFLSLDCNQSAGSAMFSSCSFPFGITVVAVLTAILLLPETLKMFKSEKRIPQRQVNRVSRPLNQVQKPLTQASGDNVSAPIDKGWAPRENKVPPKSPGLPPTEKGPLTKP